MCLFCFVIMKYLNCIGSVRFLLPRLVCLVSYRWSKDTPYCTFDMQAGIDVAMYNLLLRTHIWKFFYLISSKIISLLFYKSILLGVSVLMCWYTLHFSSRFLALKNKNVDPCGHVTLPTCVSKRGSRSISILLPPAPFFELREDGDREKRRS